MASRITTRAVIKLISAHKLSVRLSPLLSICMVMTSPTEASPHAWALMNRNDLDQKSIKGPGRPICDGSDATSVGRLRSELAPAVAPADGSAGLPNGGSGDADTINSGPKWAASQANLRDHAIRLRHWRWHHCLRRRCEC